MFVDETGFSFRSRPGTTWAPRGRTPVLRRMSKRRQLSTAVAFTLSGRIYKRNFNHAICGTDFVVFLRHLQRWVPGPLLLIWDRLQVHRRAAVKSYLSKHPEIMVEELPGYAPELNPGEDCHGDVKRHLLNATPEDIKQLRDQADRGFARLRHRPDLLLGFLRHAGYKVKRLT